jgi:acyl-CoA synthetase (AMP-forming)/AMP-acid ligase II
VGSLDAEGYLRITDRLKDMYISGGFNCYPAEIERLMHGHPSVSQAAVIGAPDPRLGELGVAFVVRKPDAVLSESDFQAWCKTVMSNYKVPRRVVFVDRLPLNAAGKVQKAELRAYLAAA